MIEVTKKEVQKLTIKTSGLDPVGVFIEEDWGLGKAKVTIEVFGEAWTYYWSSMGEMTLREFFTDTPYPYLVYKFCRVSTETDYRKIGALIGVDHDELEANGIWFHNDALTRELGDDWYEQLPTCATSEYKHLTRIVTAIREAFQTTSDEPVTVESE